MFCTAMGSATENNHFPLQGNKTESAYTSDLSVPSIPAMVMKFKLQKCKATKKASTESADACCSEGGARTLDLRIMNPTL